jgi:hypothetical protein
MKNICYLLVLILTHAACGQHVTSQPKSNLFTLPDAEKILGEKAHLTDSNQNNKSNVSIYQCTYKSDSADAKTGKTGAIYVMIEDYSEIESAKKTYSGIMESNRKNGITELDGLGDEAYFHTDNQNFYFVLVRKGNRMLRMKVNKITSVTSLEEFNRVANKITVAL